MPHGSQSSSRSLFRSNLTSAMVPHSPDMAFSIRFPFFPCCHRFAKNSIHNPCSKIELGRLFRRWCYWMSDDRYLVLRTACGSGFAQRIERVNIPSLEEACPPLLATSSPLRCSLVKNSGRGPLHARWTDVTPNQSLFASRAWLSVPRRWQRVFRVHFDQGNLHATTT
jgi:hypothetical protein